MINKKLLTYDFEKTKKKLLLKGTDDKLIDDVRDTIERKLALQVQVDKLREELNKLNNEIKLVGGKDETLRKQIALKKDELKDIEPQFNELEQKEKDLLYLLPNPAADNAPVGKHENDNVVVSYHNYNADDYKDKTYKSHWELGEALDIFDSKRATKVSGAMFSMLKGDGASLLRALISLGLDLNREKYTEIIAPHFVTTNTITSTGHLPKFKDDQYKIDGEEMWANPTAEVPLTGMHAGETFKENELPVRYMAYCVSFRKEAGSAGKDTRGMQRLHEFHKVEMMELCKPEDIEKEWLSMVDDATRIIELLKLPYRIVDLCTGDMGDKYARCYDIEVYTPAFDKWLEVSSIGYFTDYQSRRANIKYLKEDGTKELVYTLNGSAMATPRVWAAILEHYQNEDGTITVPEVLVPYMKKTKISF